LQVIITFSYAVVIAHWCKGMINLNFEIFLECLLSQLIPLLDIFIFFGNKRILYLQWNYKKRPCKPNQDKQTKIYKDLRNLIGEEKSQQARKDARVGANVLAPKSSAIINTKNIVLLANPLIFELIMDPRISFSFWYWSSLY
jgi:hypothetical protein